MQLFFFVFLYREFDSAVQDDLFEHLNQEAKNNSKIPAHLTMKEIMDTWTLQPGFPLVRVSVASPMTVYISQVGQQCI